MHIRQNIAGLLGPIVLAILAALPPASHAQACRMVRVAEWTLQVTGNRPIVEGQLNGRKAGILVDTGASTTVIARSAATRLGLELQSVSGVQFYGVGGATRVETTEVEEFRIGAAVRRNWRLLALGEQEMGRNIDVVLGEDFLGNFDVELDFANKVMRLFQPQGCERSPLAYWAPGAPSVELLAGRKIDFPVKIDEAPVRATLDTGSTRSILASQVAAQLGITPASPGIEPGGCMLGIGKRRVDGWIATMKSFSIGDETIHNPRLSIADINPGAISTPLGSRIARQVDDFPVMMLGTDFLLAHRVLVARSQKKLYFTHNGGHVFTVAAAPTCTEQARMTADERAERLEAALRERPDDPQLLYRRAQARAQKGDVEGAIGDYDRAIELRPEAAAPWLERGTLRMRRLEFDQAIADYDRYIALKPADTLAVALRGHVWRYKGDTAKARADYDAALRADPHEKAALRGRALLAFEEARYADAQRDFAEWLRLGNDPYAALWTYLARLRSGEDGGKELFDYERRTRPEGWARDLVRYHLGEMTADELLQAAAAAGDKRQAQECEARFNIAERRLAAADTAGALPLLRQARAECPPRFDEYFAAAGELKRLE